MITAIQKPSDTAIIVIHEIYGVNQHVKNFCESLSQQGYTVICPNVLERDTPFDYSQERLAYQHFMENIGFDNALYRIKTILAAIKSGYERVYIVGFSIGATVAWLCSEEEGVNGVVGYYGSRIRDYAAVSPKVPTLLFFPEEETSFNVDEFLPIFRKKNVKIYKLKGQHGFSNPYSIKYNERSAQEAHSRMMNFFQEELQAEEHEEGI